MPATRPVQPSGLSEAIPPSTTLEEIESSAASSVRELASTVNELLSTLLSGLDESQPDHTRAAEAVESFRTMFSEAQATWQEALRVDKVVVATAKHLSDVRNVVEKLKDGEAQLSTELEKAQSTMEDSRQTVELNLERMKAERKVKDLRNQRLTEPIVSCCLLLCRDPLTPFLHCRRREKRRSTSWRRGLFGRLSSPGSANKSPLIAHVALRRRWRSRQKSLTNASKTSLIRMRLLARFAAFRSRTPCSGLQAWRNSRRRYLCKYSSELVAHSTWQPPPCLCVCVTATEITPD